VPLPAGIAADADLATLETQLRPWLRGERKLAGDDGAAGATLFAAVILPAGLGPGATNALRYWCENQADTDLRGKLEDVLNADFRRQEYGRLGVDPELVARVEGLRAPVTSLNPKKAEGEERVGLADTLRQWAPSFFVYLLWVAIFAISQMLLNGVIEEKSNRIIEVLLSSVTPGELMTGKLLGIAAVGLVMLGTWLTSLLGLSLLGARSLAGSAAAQLPADVLGVLQTTWLVPGFIAYFLLGYVLYAALFLTLGSLCNTLKEAQNLMGPVMVVMMVPLFLMPFIPRDPNGPLATALSWVPLYTPFVMMNRITADPPWTQVAGTGLLLVAFTGLVVWGCGRIFRLAILRTGQPPRLAELFKWVRGG
jgi:ABC-2 type transport system permease protein